MELSDRDLAVRLLALDEGDDDPMAWVEHFDKQFDRWATEEHSGDCTSQPWTCSRCVYEGAMQRVRVARKLSIIK